MPSIRTSPRQEPQFIQQLKSLVRVALSFDCLHPNRVRSCRRESHIDELDIVFECVKFLIQPYKLNGCW